MFLPNQEKDNFLSVQENSTILIYQINKKEQQIQELIEEVKRIVQQGGIRCLQQFNSFGELNITSEKSSSSKHSQKSKKIAANNSNRSKGNPRPVDTSHSQGGSSQFLNTVLDNMSSHSALSNSGAAHRLVSQSFISNS